MRIEGAVAPPTVAMDSAPVTPRMFYMLVLLMFAGFFSIVDRQIITILIEPIKHDLSLSDTDMGLLTGIAFAAVYMFASFPVARWADRSDRRVVLALCVGVWSVMTALCGGAQSFWQLCVARAGVAAGEAGANPVSQSLVADIFPLRFRAKAMAALIAGPALGISAGMFLGGWIATWWNWRAAFVIVGLPGLLVSAIIWLTMRDPRPASAHKEMAGAESIWSTIRALMRITTFHRAMFGLGLYSIAGFGWLTWAPTFLKRVHGMALGHIGLWLGLSNAIGIILGAFVIGSLADRLGSRNPAWYARIPALGAFFASAIGVAFVMTPNPYVGVAIFLPLAAALSAWAAPTYTLVQCVVDHRSRAMAAAVVGFFSSFLGTSLGPLLVGATNDLLAPHLGQEAIRYSLLLALPLLFTGGLLFWAASATAKIDLARAAARAD